MVPAECTQQKGGTSDSTSHKISGCRTWSKATPNFGRVRPLGNHHHGFWVRVWIGQNFSIIVNTGEMEKNVTRKVAAIQSWSKHAKHARQVSIIANVGWIFVVRFCSNPSDCTKQNSQAIEDGYGRCYYYEQEGNGDFGAHLRKLHRDR